MSDDPLIFAEEDDYQVKEVGDDNPWLVAIVDDDHHVHDVTRLALKNFRFDGRPLQFLSAYSGEEGFRLFQQHRDIAICLLDVVMETEVAGLELARDIRQTLNNAFTRIVLRTGQPGQAPEEQVISQFDINDYKEKTELTRTKLHTVVYSCLRSYRDILALDQNRRGLERVLHSTTSILSGNFVEKFTQGVLQQVTSILEMGHEAFYGQREGLAAHQDNSHIRIVAGVGNYENSVGYDAFDVIPPDMAATIQSQRGEFVTHHSQNDYVCALRGKNGQQNILFLRGLKERSGLEKSLVEIFTHNVLIAFENMYLLQEVDEAQKELVLLLGEAVENRSLETGNHLVRVAEISYLLGREMGLSEHESLRLKDAAPLHDLGKVGIPDAILHKPGKLTEQEWKIMKTHVDIGVTMLSHSKKPLVLTAQRIVQDHHEWWNGQGYPKGTKGDQISLEGRIVAVADVFDALLHKRCYKDPWEMNTVLKYMRDQSGVQFDPQIISALMSQLNKIMEILEQNPSDT